MPAVALTDHGSLAGIVQFYKAARTAGIKPILGLELYVASDRHSRGGGVKERFAHLTLLARDERATATSSSCPRRPTSRATTTSRAPTGSCSAAHAEGLIALTGCMSGRASILLREGNDTAALQEIERLVELFGRENVYVELQDAGLPEQHELHAQARAARPPGRRQDRGHQRRPLPAQGGRPRPRRPALHPGRKASSTSRAGAAPVDAEFYLKTPDEMRGSSPTTPRPATPRSRSPSAATCGCRRRATCCLATRSPTAGPRTSTCASWSRRVCAGATAPGPPRPRCASGSSSSSASSARWASAPTS